MLPCPFIQLSSSFARPHPPLRDHGLQALRRGGTVTVPEQRVEDAPRIINTAAAEYLRAFGINEEKSKAILEQAPPSVDASRIEHLFQVLTTEIKIPISRVVDVVSAAPELLTLDPASIAANYKTISGAWPTERQLRNSTLAYPAMLNPSFPTDLRRCMTTLQGLGFSNAQTAAAVTSCPRLAGLRRYEITSALARCGIVGSKIEDPEMLKFLSKHPMLLTPEGSTDLHEILEAVRKAAGVTAQQAQHIVARGFKGLVDSSIQDIRIIVDLLRNYGLTQAEVAQAALAWPPLLSRKADAVQETLQILSSYEIKPKQIVDYPRVFYHRNLTVIGPRLAYLAAYNSEDLSLYLGTLFKPTDEAFDCKRAPKNDPDAQSYSEFRVTWLVQQKLREQRVAKSHNADAFVQQQQQQPKVSPPGPPGQKPAKKPQKLRYFNGSNQQLQRLTPEQVARKQKQKQGLNSQAPVN